MTKKDIPEERRQTMDLLWAEKREPSRGPKPALDLKQIARTAIAIADTEGLEAVSMQRVARACGVATMALYRYVPDKAAMLALMIDIGLGEPPVANDVQVGWRPQLEAWARALWAIFRAHPWSLKVTTPVRLLGPNELGWFEAAIQILSGTKLTGPEMVDAVDTLIAYIRGKAMFSTEEGQPLDADKRWESVMPELLHKYAERFPGLAGANAAGAFSKPPSDELEFGLRLLLDGLGVHITEKHRL